ncbi:MAG: o-succinylbenzoic acid synthetase [Gemmatimonadetes bacterium]|nr:o-succinylbenzoic acid synthetase [Gemmatimonadota bacterium]
MTASSNGAGTLRIDRMILREIRLELREPFRISSGIVTDRRIALLELFDASGASTWSECVAFQLPNYTAETIETAWLAIREWLAPRILGRDFAGPEEIHAVLEKNIRGHNMAKAAVEMGCWGLASVLRDLPLSAILGGTRDRVATGISLGIQSEPALLVQRAEAAVAAGYRKIKVKIQPGQDVEYVRAVRDALGDSVGMMADANSAYTLKDVEHLAQLDDLGLIMLEQPLGDDDLVRHATLQRRMRTPICLDESITSVDRAEDMITLQSGRIINIKPGRVGGLSAAKAIHDVAQRAGMPVWCGGMLESGIGRAYNVALASLPNFSLPGDLSPSARYWARDIVSPEWTMDDEGMVHVPREAGLGVSVDEDRIEALTVRREELRPARATVGVT